MKLSKISGIISIMILLSLLYACAATPAGNDGSGEVTSPPPDGVSQDTPPGSEEIPAQEDPYAILKNVSSLELARMMGYGINLGNTMEACNSNDRVPNREPYVYETMWGQPVTTQEIITGMKEAGFKTLRIPVAWTNAMDFENGDYTIGQAYLDRVEEIINYALNEDMFVIINNHWDHGWWAMFGHPQKETRDKAMEIFVSMWTQISEQYAGYDLRLVFEPANEEWGDRFNDRNAFSPEGGILTEDERFELLHKLSQTFVDLVRSSGGNNADRFLLIPGYNTDFTKTFDVRYKMPDDSADSKLLLSVHYYTPWSYCGDTSGVGSWGRVGEVEEMNELFTKLLKYTDQGYGIVIGEWGVLDNEGPDRLTYFTNFLDNCDLYGAVPLLWDCNNLYSKEERRIIADDIAGLFAKRSIYARAGKSAEDIILDAKDNMAWTLKKAEERPETVITADEAFAWIMFASGDWSIQYSVGDQYKPESIADGVIATDAEVTAGEGTYTVALDFTGTAAGYADGIAFSAVGIINGELLYPGWHMVITEVLINGERAVFSGIPYTTNDNFVTTRVNLYNGWVDDVMAVREARVYYGDMSDATAVPLSDYLSTQIETLSVTFDYLPGD